jgi:Peptidylarginine deiminase and related enzymes
MKKTFLSLAIAILALSFSVCAQQKDNTTIEQLKAKALLKMKTAPKDAFNSYYRLFHKRVPNDEAIRNAIPQKKAIVKGITKEPLAVPDNMIFPGEFDEVQAILMTWPYVTKTVSGDQYAEQLFDGYGVYSDSYTLVPVYSTPDVSVGSTTKLFASLADGIQHHAQVWINVWSTQDTTTIKNFMTQNGTPLTNYRFFVNPGNSFWYRDCGPVAFYYGDNDSIGFADFEYYGGRPLDDAIGRVIGQEAGFPVYTNTIEYEGGNILVDGLGSLFTSSAVYSNNTDHYGLYYMDSTSQYGYSQQYKQALTKAQVNDSLSHLLNLNRCTVLPKLNYDGGTGHVDLYVDMVDEATFVSTKYPDTLASTSDAQRVEKNMDSMQSFYAECPFSQKYYNTRIPFPAKDDGSWYSSQNEYNSSYTRSFSNHTFVNDAIMQPVFYNTTSGDSAGNVAAIEKMAQTYPGYQIVQIDVRDFDGYGGALHCITKQIPATNPIRIYHYPMRWFNTTDYTSSSVLLTAFIQNHSGIASANLYYRQKGATDWTTLAMAFTGGNIYNVPLPINDTVTSDTIEYYISATSNNGKTITKPMTAPQGYYTFVYGTNTTGNGDYSSLDRVEDIKQIEMGDFSPNPAMQTTSIKLAQPAKTNIPVKVINLKGQVIKTAQIAKGQTYLQFNVSNFKGGEYWAIFGDNASVAVKKLIVIK